MKTVPPWGSLFFFYPASDQGSPALCVTLSFLFSDSLFINSRLSNVSLWPLFLFAFLSSFCLCVFCWFLFLLFSFQFNSSFEVCFTRCFWLCLVQLVGFLFASAHLVALLSAKDENKHGNDIYTMLAELWLPQLGIWWVCLCRRVCLCVSMCV